MTDFLLYLGLTLLFVHEMDAIRRKEWKMFIFLKDLNEDLEYWIQLALDFNPKAKN